MLDVTIRTLDGRSTSLCLAEDAVFREIKSMVDAQLKGSFKLLARGREAQPDETLCSLNLQAGEFLVALPIRKRNADNRKQQAASDPNALKSSLLPSLATSLTPSSSQQAQPAASKLSDEQSQQLNERRASNSRASTPVCGSRDFEDKHLSPAAQMQSPLREEPGLYTLLPGYVSRPHSSPHKRQRLSASAVEEGGFVPAGRQLPAAENPPSQRPQAAVSAVAEAADCGSISTGRQLPAAEKQPPLRLQAAERASHLAARELRKATEDSLWADLARELHQAQQRAIPQPESSSVRALAMPEIDQTAKALYPANVQRTDTHDGGQQSEIADAHAKKLIMALAKTDDPVFSPPKRPSKEPRMAKVAAKRILPGGHDLRLTVKGKITAKEAAAVAQLPLPPSLERLEHIFEALNTVYCFLQLKNIQANWTTLHAAVRSLHGTQHVKLADIRHMAELCPEVVFLQDTRSDEGPRSIKEFNRKISARASVGGDGRQISGSVSQSDGSQTLQPSATDDPMHIHSDAADLLPQRDGDYLVVEISEASRHSVAMIARAMSKSQPLSAKDELPAELLEQLQLPTESAVAALEQQQDAEEQRLNENHDDLESKSEAEEEEKEQQRERGLRNKTTRRRGAFRRGLIRCVMLLHDDFMAKRSQATGKGASRAAPQPEEQLSLAAEEAVEGIAARTASLEKELSTKVPASHREKVLEKEVSTTMPISLEKDLPITVPVKKPRAGRAITSKPATEEKGEDTGFDPLKEGRWHSDFPVASLSLEGVRAVAVEATRVLTLAEQQGRARPVWEGVLKDEKTRPSRMTRKHDPCRDCTHMSVEKFLQHLESLPWYAGQVTHIEDMPARLGDYQETSHPLSRASQRALRAKGFKRLFKHQAQAIDAAREGQHVVVSTSTASGKSLCYNIPVIEAVSENASASAIYIFPTKALAQDQLRALREFIGAAFPVETPIADVYDGDTPKDERAEVRSRAQLLITNPDMLHQSILPVHRQFSGLLANLRYVIVDEGHAYRGVFGCHTALVLRRLRRICEREYSAFPTFVVTSATIANPRDHVLALLGVDEVRVISEDGSPHGPQRFVLWNPPLTAPNHALAVANGVQMSRTEGRARKAERKRASKRRVQKAVDAAEGDVDLEDTPEANISLAMSAARIHRRRFAAGAASDLLADLGCRPTALNDAVISDDTRAATATAVGEENFQNLAANEAEGFADAVMLEERHAAAAANEAKGFTDAVMLEEMHAAGAANEADVHQVVTQQPGTAAPQGHPALPDFEWPTASASAPRQDAVAPPGQDANSASRQDHNAKLEAETAQSGGKQQSKGKTGGTRRKLSTAAIQAAMDASALEASRPRQQEQSKGVCASVEDALAAVSQVGILRGDRPRFEPKNIVYRSDEPGSSSNNRPLLRRRLHGHRYGQKSGIAHPAGQYAHASQASEVQARMPGKEWRSKEFKDKWGTAGVSLDQRRKSPIVEISVLLAECVQHGLRTIAFCKTRKLCELVITYTREMLRASAPHLTHAISVYRAGYSPTERREIEKALFNGTLFAVAATNALELGLDVGSLDMTMHLGFQGSIASFRQQAGRAGRREQQSMSIYVAFDGPLDQYFMTYPRQLFDRPIEAAHIDPGNLMLLEQHLACAAFEAPLVFATDERFFGPKIHKAADTLVLEGLLGRHPLAAQAHALHYIGRYENPAARFSLRAIDPDRYQIINEADGGYVMEEIEESKAFFQVYDGAVYMFQGRTYLCKKLDLATKTAIVRPVDVKYYTSIREHTDIFVVGGSAAYPTPETVLKQLRGDEEPTMAQCAEAEVTTRWMGFHRIRHGTGEIFDTVDLFLPDVQFPTQAAYLRVPPTAKARLGEAGLPWREGLHAAMHAMQNVVPLHMMCGVNDLGAECDNPYSARFRPDRLLLFDKHPGGIGLAYKVCDLFGVLMRKAMALIEACPCTNPTGCPGCVQHMACNQYNAVLHKQAGIVVLQATLEAQIEFRQQLEVRLERETATANGQEAIMRYIGSRLG